MENIIDDIVCDLLSNNEPITQDPTLAIENLTALHDVFEEYGEQPELVELTGLTKNDVDRYLSTVDTSAEGLFSKIGETIKKTVASTINVWKQRSFSKRLAVAKKSLKPRVRYIAEGFGANEHGHYEFGNAVQIYRLDDPFLDDFLLRKSADPVAEYKQKIDKYKETFVCKKMAFYDFDFESIIRLAKNAEDFFIKVKNDLPEKQNKWQKDVRNAKAFSYMFKEYLLAVKFAQTQSIKMLSSVLFAVQKNKTEQE